MSLPSEPTPPPPGVVFKAVVASTVGTTIEWYDFFLYGMAAAMVFPQLFFPKHDPFVAQLLSFSTFTVGFLARPVGGVLFGYLGDRIGRKSTLVITLLLMGICTILIGLLPTYEQIGIAAPLLLTLLRVGQGLGVGGEWGGAMLLALEYGHRGRRGFLTSWPQAGVPGGLLLATGALYLFKVTLSEADFLAWGWRVPFLLSSLLILVGFIIRARIPETPLFQELQASGRVSRRPLIETLQQNWREVLLTAGARMGENAGFYLFTAYILTYTEKVLGFSYELALLGVALAASIEFFAIPFFGYLSDILSRKALYLTGSVFLIAFAFPYYYLLHSGSPALVITAIVLSVLGGHAIMCAVIGAFLPELFPTRLRYTGASLGYQLGSPLAGGIAPLIATSLVAAYPGQFWPLALYVMLIGVISLVSVLFLAETSRKEIHET